MKTLVLLSALASIALAAPTLQEEGLDNTDRISDWSIPVHTSIPESLKRDKKSTLEEHAPISAITEVGTPSPLARSFTKQPVIVKKKSGYRLYRDSDEEKANADPQESCGRQVKVKLCDEDGKFKEMMRSSPQEMNHEHTTEEDMKHSIKMAKDAVENLQRDLMKMEQKSAAMKMAHDDESDSDLHRDIEGVRQALEHIHMNFENLDTASLHATASRDSETTHDVHLTIARSEQEKMAQWKEAVQNIHNTVEIARNIQDSFKSADNHDGLHLDQSGAASTKHESLLEDRIFSPAELVGDEHLRAADTTHLKIESVEKEDDKTKPLSAATIEQLKEHHAREDQHTEDRLTPSTSDDIQMTSVDIKNNHMLRSENHQHHEHEKSAQQLFEEHTTSGQERPMENIQNIQEHHHLLSMKEAEGQERKNLGVNRDLLFKASQNVEDTHMAASTDSVKTLSALEEHQRSTEIKPLVEKSEHHLKLEKPLTGIEHVSSLLPKSVEHIDEDHKEKTLEGTHLHMFSEKSAAGLKSILQENNSHNFGIKQKEAIPSSLVKSEDKERQEMQLHKFHNIDEQNENMMRAAEHSIKHNNEHHKIDYNESEHDTPLTKMKSAEDHRHHLTELKSDNDHMRHRLTEFDGTRGHLHHMDTIPGNMRWAQSNRHSASMKAAEEPMKDFNRMDHLRNSHYGEHHFIPNNMGMSHDFEMSEHHMHPHHIHTPERYHHNMMHHSNMHDMVRGAAPSSFHPSMRDAMEGLGSEHMFRWKPAHESARNAYGGGLSGSIGGSLGGSIGGSSSGGGAVGVFPSANTGGCGIPLLLSCSPSVVSGSLAKAHASGPSSYGASAYRAEEDFGFHNKRDIKKANDIKNIKTLRTPAIVKQKTGTILENQL
ncbi:uncharacterized protein LOC142972488 [Anticarsia gemmatalis]|uniref:uncharacterized protein LOC142972488 n=1 Tax=Anticarsia gemmatalis TaxID=129554 RepID=UPI003F772A4F